MDQLFFFWLVFFEFGFALCFKAKLLNIVLTPWYLLAIAFCELPSSESMWWKCVLVGANILGCTLLGLSAVVSAHTEVLGNSHWSQEPEGTGNGSCAGVETKCSHSVVHFLSTILWQPESRGHQCRSCHTWGFSRPLSVGTV